VVWHHRRNSIRAYLRQQKGYGKAEALLERKWPEKYNIAGHLKWAGKVYGVHFTRWRADRIYHGTWGLAPFQSLYEPAPGMIDALPMMPEWNLLVALLGLLSLLSFLWPPLRLSWPVFGVAAAMPLVQAGWFAARVTFAHAPHSRAARIKLRMVTAWLHLLQPLARLWGRLRHGLTLWRRPAVVGLALPRPFAALSAGAANDLAWDACFALGAVALLVASRTIHECAAATAAFLTATRKIEWEEKCDERR